jgi:hypothetical protein
MNESGMELENSVDSQPATSAERSGFNAAIIQYVALAAMETYSDWNVWPRNYTGVVWINSS